MRRLLIIYGCILYVTSFLLNGQTITEGVVLDENQEAIYLCNIAIKGTYKGVSTDIEGRYSIAVEEGDTLVFTYIGYFEQEHGILVNTLADTLYVDVQLKPQINILTNATIIEKRKTEIARISTTNMSQQQIFTTAGEPGNILMAIQGESSASVSPETGRLLVRGGRASESQFYMDGLLINTPYVNTPNGISSRLKQNPYVIERVDLYNGTFSTEYGQALSSIVALNTKQQLKEDSYGLSLSTLGINANIQKRMEKGGIIFNSDFIDLSFNNLLSYTTVDWVKPYKSFFNQILWNLPINDRGKLKVYANTSHSRLEIRDYYEQEQQRIKLEDNQSNFSVFYKHLLSDKWDVSFASTYQSERRNTDIETNLEETLDHAYIHTKGVIKRYFNQSDFVLKGGGEYFRRTYEQAVFLKQDTLDVQNNATYNNLALFLEGERKIASILTLRGGIRLDDIYTDRRVLSYRILLGYEPSNTFSVVGFYGTFYQAPDTEYLYYNTELENEKSEQFLLTANYHKGGRDLSLSGYRKNYQGLIAYTTNDYRLFPNELSNKGDGYVHGLDVVFVDRNTIPFGELKCSYAYVHARKKYLNYDAYRIPDYIYKHRLSLLAKKYISTLNSNISLTLTLAKGRYYDNPYTIDILEEEALGLYKNLSFNYTYLLRVLGSSVSYLHLSVDNVFNFKNEVNLLYQNNGQVIKRESNNRRSIFIAFILNFK